MTGPEHYREAEHLLRAAAACVADGNDVEADHYEARAQVHATLALAAATVTIAAETPDLADDRQRRLVTDWLETYATDTNEDLDALLARIRRPSTQRAKPETSQVTPDGRSWGWLQ